MRLSETNQSIPKNWVWVTIEKIGDGSKYPIVDGPFGSNLKVSDYIDNGKIPVISISNIDEGFDKSKLRFISQEKFKSIERSAVNPGDIIMAKIGSSYGKCGYYPENMPIGMIPANMLKISISKSMNKSYVYYYFKSHYFKIFLNQIVKSTAQPAFNLSSFKELPFPLPPLNEQNHIVTKLEELFTKLDAGIEYLKKTRILLKQYRQSVLKHAFEGKLTEKWRKENKHKVEYEIAQLKNKINEKIQKHKGFVSNKSLKKLPEEWFWIQLNVVCNKIQDGSHFSPKLQYNNAGKDLFLYITAKNIKEYGLDLSDVKYVDKNFHNEIYSRCNAERGDVLLVKDGVKTGIAAINTLEEPFSLLSSVALFKPSRDFLDSGYLKHYLNSPNGFSMITNQMTGTAIKRIILDKIRVSLIPLTSISEQEKINEQLELHLSQFDYLSKIIKNTIRASQQLKNSILKNAFEGKLVTQDPNDEPAGILLERIKRERESIIPIKKEKSKLTKRKSIGNDSKQMRLM